jgi:glucose/arabinose dehydrogenase
LDSAPDKQWKEPCYSGSVVTGRPADYAPKAPAGFQVKVFTADLKAPRVMKVAPDGDVFVTETNSGRIRVIRPAAGGDKPSDIQVFAEGLAQPSGIAFYPAADPQWVYVGETEHIVRFPYRTGDLKARSPAETVVAARSSPATWCFTEDGQVWGRPAGLAFLKDGSLLVGDDANSVIYRVAYTGGGK